MSDDTLDLMGCAARFANAPVLPYTPRVIDVTGTVPWNPSEEVQRKFVGATFDQAYLDAARFVEQAQTWMSGRL